MSFFEAKGIMRLPSLRKLYRQNNSKAENFFKKLRSFEEKQTKILFFLFLERYSLKLSGYRSEPKRKHNIFALRKNFHDVSVVLFPYVKHIKSIFED